MNSQFKKGIIEMCVIAVVSNKDMYGFEVIDNLSKAIDVNENTVYPILRRLTDQGYFETYTEPTTFGAPRKYFRITPSGVKKMEEYRREWTTFLSGVYQILGGNQT
jgi:PadR family transcriptional regulator PadR